MKITGVQRFDLGQMGNTERTPQGFLKVGGFATRTGVFSYLDSKGKLRRELRHPDQVFDPNSLATLKYAPVTIEHPPVMLTPDNVGKYSKGHATERVEVNRDLVETDLIIEDAEAISAVEEDGMRELSAGYVADLVEEAGTYNGAPYDYRQVGIKYNHIAIVKRGRAGPEVRLRLDSADAIMQVVETPANEFQPEGENDGYDSRSDVEDGDTTTREVVVSGRSVEMPDWLADIWEDMSDRYDEMKAQTLKLQEDHMPFPEKKDKKDADVSQKNISPQVKVEQKAPDGRGASGKVGPGATNGAAKAKGLDGDEKDPGAKKDEDDEKKKDEDEKKDEDGKEDADEEKKDFEGAPAGVGGGSAQSPAQQLKDSMEQMRTSHAAQMDAMQAKLDEMAAPGLGGGESAPKMDSKAWKETVRKRVALERSAEKMVSPETMAKFDSMSDDEIRAAVIKSRHPAADLRGKSSVYLESRFDSILETVEGSDSLRREMGGGLVRREHLDSAQAADPQAKRREMTKNSQALWQQPLSASKK